MRCLGVESSTNDSAHSSSNVIQVYDAVSDDVPMTEDGSHDQ